jgi:ABC-type nitrate/sulfonate/bicarbonate transport system permease component
MGVSILGQHFLISLVPWLTGIVAGGVLGYACALVARRLFSTRPGWRRVSMLLPWRTVAMTLPLLSPLIVIYIGLGTVTGAVMVGIFVFLFALPLTVVTLLEHWYPSPLVVRLIARARTLAVASVAVAAVGPPVTGSGGAGVLIFEGMQLLDYAQMLRGFAIVVVLALVVDVLLGALQWLFYRLFFRHLWEPRWQSSVRSARKGDPSVVAPLNQMGVAKTCDSDDFSCSKRLKSPLPSTDFGHTQIKSRR